MTDEEKSLRQQKCLSIEGCWECHWLNMWVRKVEGKWEKMDTIWIKKKINKKVVDVSRLHNEEGNSGESVTERIFRDKTESK